MKSLKLFSLVIAILLTVSIFSACSNPTNPKYSNSTIHGKVEKIDGQMVTVTIVENWESFVGLSIINPDDIKIEISTAPASEEGDVVLTVPDDLDIFVKEGEPVDLDIPICTYGEQITVYTFEEISKGL